MVGIREAQSDDRDLLLVLVRKFASSFETRTGSFVKSIEDVLADPNADLLVAERGSSPVGYVLAFHHLTFFANGIVTWIEELFVEDEFRGQGIGRELVVMIEQKAKERDSRLIALATRRAEDFYKAIGYEESATYFRKLL